MSASYPQCTPWGLARLYGSNLVQSFHELLVLGHASGREDAPGVSGDHICQMLGWGASPQSGDNKVTSPQGGGMDPRPDPVCPSNGMAQQQDKHRHAAESGAVPYQVPPKPRVAPISLARWAEGDPGEKCGSGRWPDSPAGGATSALWWKRQMLCPALHQGSLGSEVGTHPPQTCGRRMELGPQNQSLHHTEDTATSS